MYMCVYNKRRIKNVFFELRHNVVVKASGVCVHHIYRSEYLVTFEGIEQLF